MTKCVEADDSRMRPTEGDREFAEILVERDENTRIAASGLQNVLIGRRRCQ